MNRLSALSLCAMLAGLAFAQGPNVTKVENAATLQTNDTVPLAPGMLFAIFGSSLANQIAQPSSLVLESTLGGATVTFSNGSTTLTSPLQYVQPDNTSTNVPSQINAQVPWEIAPDPGTTQTWNVTVTNNGATSAPVPVTIGAYSPGIFADGTLGIVINLDGTLAWPVGALPPLTTHPAHAGDTVIIYATGLGTVDVPLADGANSLDQLRHTQATPTVLIGGQPAQVAFSGMTPQFPGVNQLNVVIPNVPPGSAVPVQIQMGGITSPVTITFAISQ